MTIAYLLNTYPVPSATFIRREVEALETLGLSISRFAVRRFNGDLVDERDIVEQSKVIYILEDNRLGLVSALVKQFLCHPISFAKALPLWVKLVANADGGFIRHFAYLMQACYFYQRATRLDISHVHAHFGTNSAAVAMLSHALGGCSYSFTAHGPDEFADPIAISYAEKIKHATFVIAISDYCKRMLLKLSSDLYSAKINVARCGIDLSEFPFSAANEPKNETLICVGRLCPQKGQIHIPAAAAALKREFPGLRIILVGDGESRPLIEEQIRHHQVEDIVFLHGWASNPEVIKLISGGRAFILPSYAEGLPIVLMESLALGRPVITTRIAGIGELVDDDCGWLIEPGNHDQLVRALRDCLSASSATLETMAKVGRIRVEAMHNRMDLAKYLLSLFAAASSSRMPMPTFGKGGVSIKT